LFLRVKVKYILARTSLVREMSSSARCCAPCFFKKNEKSTTTRGAEIHISRSQSRRRAFAAFAATADDDYDEYEVKSSNTSTAKLIETVAANILKFNLKTQTSVVVAVNSDDFEALTRGKVRQVQIKGTDWSSRKRLTCKALDVSVGEVGVDYSKIVSTGRIEIRKPGGRGRAKLFMSFEDFRNFLKHPLTNEALRRARLTFEDEAPRRDAAALVLKAKFDEDRNAVRAFRMQPASEEDERVEVVDVSDGSNTTNSSNNNSEQAERVKRFFETLELDLMGTKLRYRNMRVEENGVALDLNVLVERFPPPVIDF
jgi:hypothetical protein